MVYVVVWENSVGASLSGPEQLPDYVGAQNSVGASPLVQNSVLIVWEHSFLIIPDKFSLCF
jgi:hypothetical protein